jgi:hypothetical protein
MDQSYIAENNAERTRLQALVARLTDADPAQATSEDWTVGVGLLHLAFWDRLSLAKFEAWERTGTVDIPPLRDMVDGINQAMLPWWRTVAPAQIRYEVVAAAAAVDRKAETLPAPIVEAIPAACPLSLTRAIHRRQHPDRGERALAGEAPPPVVHATPCEPWCFAPVRLTSSYSSNRANTDTRGEFWDMRG